MAVTFVDQYTTAAVFTGTLALTFVLWHQMSRQRGNGRLPPSVGTLPIVGSLLFLPDVKKLHTYFLDKSYEIGDVISFQTFHMYTVVLNSYDTIREVLVKQSTEAADRPYYHVNKYLNPQYKGIIDHYYNPSFKKYHQLSLSILKEFGFGGSLMESRIALEVEDLISSLKDLQGALVYPKSLVASSVMSVISSIAIGDRLKDKETNEKVATAVDDFFKSSNQVFLMEYIRALRYLPNFKTHLDKVLSAQDVIMDVIDKNIRKYQSTDNKLPPPGESFISSFMSREGEEFDVDQLKYTIRDLLLAGYETSSTTLIWIILTLANEREVQERLQKELDSVVTRTRLPALEDKARLPYLEAVILEVMRCHTLVPLGLPHRAVTDVTVNDFVIPKGTQIMTNIYAAHMDRKAWEEPERFRPERFLDSTGTKVINKEKVISFSLGKRSCLGELLARQEIYLFTAGLLQQFHILPPEDMDHLAVEEVVTLTIQPSHFNVRFLTRA